jgi:zinc transporter ZupT
MNVLSRALHSQTVRLALVAVVGVVVMSASGAPLAGLAAVFAGAMLVLTVRRFEDAHRRKREKREHIAGLGRW